ncbi:hsp70, partial [Symbiodinium microadriaticum]
KSTGNEKKITIKNDRDRLSAEDIERLVQEAERHRVEDEHNRVRSEALTVLESYVLHNLHTINADAVRHLMTPEQLKTANDALAAEKTWLEEHKTAAEKEEFDQRLETIKAILIPIVQAFGHHEPPPTTAAPDAAPAATGRSSPVDAESAFQQGEDH